MIGNIIANICLGIALFIGLCFLFMIVGLSIDPPKGTLAYHMPGLPIVLVIIAAVCAIIMLKK